MNVDWVPLERIPRYSRLFVDLARRAKSLEPFFPTRTGAESSADIAQLLGAAARAVAGQGLVAERAAVSERLAVENSALGACPESVAAARSLADPRTVVVVAGQQPGLFGGPLLTVYKVMTALRLAAEIDRGGEFRAVPLYWCHSDDHDLEEANQYHLLTRDFEVRKLRVPWSPSGRPLHERKADAPLFETVEEIRSALPPTARREATFAALSPRDGEPLGAWSCRVLLELFRGQPVVVLEPRWLRREAAPVLAAAATLGGSVRDSILETGRAVARLGYEPGLKDATPPFLFEVDDAGERRRVSTGRSDALAERIRREPERFSPDVALRPVVQSAILPCAALVTGPGEAAYLAQLGGLYEALGVKPPLVLPRLTATLLEARVEAARSAFGIGRESLLEIGEEPPRVDEVPAEVLSAFAAARSSLDREMARVRERLESVSPSAAEGLEHALSSVRESLDRIERRAEEPFKEARGRGRSRYRRLVSSVLPRGMLQERIFGALPFVVRYGTGWIQALSSAHVLPAIPTSHALVTFDSDEAEPSGSVSP